MQFGGGIPATMINLSRLGVESRIITFAGHDSFSEFVKKTLNSYPVKTVNLYKGNKMPVVLSSTLLYCGDRSFIPIQMEWILMMLLWMKFMKI